MTTPSSNQPVPADGVAGGCWNCGEPVEEDLIDKYESGWCDCGAGPFCAHCYDWHMKYHSGWR